MRKSSVASFRTFSIKTLPLRGTCLAMCLGLCTSAMGAETLT
jgi:hypothetical protein